LTKRPRPKPKVKVSRADGSPSAAPLSEAGTFRSDRSGAAGFTAASGAPAAVHAQHLDDVVATGRRQIECGEVAVTLRQCGDAALVLAVERLDIASATDGAWPSVAQSGCGGGDTRVRSRETRRGLHQTAARRVLARQVVSLHRANLSTVAASWVN
jgi:hypothetical protein